VTQRQLSVTELHQQMLDSSALIDRWPNKISN